MNEGDRIFNAISKFEQSEMILTQFFSYKSILEKKELAPKTITRKMWDVGKFFIHIDKIKRGSKRIRWDNVNDILYDYIINADFTSDDMNVGSANYRRAIYSNIRDSVNYIYEDMIEGKVIKPLTEDQIKAIDEISMNKFFRCTGERDSEDSNQTIQTKLIEDLGIKVYFDENDKAYVFSHEVAEILKIENKHIREKLSKLSREMDSRNFDRHLNASDFNVLEDTYLNSQNKKQPTLRLYKDMLFLYLMDTTAQGSKRFDIIQFKMKYIDAFNYIEEEHTKLMEKHMELKQSFLDMYNSMRKQNRDVLTNGYKQYKNNLIDMKRKAV